MMYSYVKSAIKFLDLPEKNVFTLSNEIHFNRRWTQDSEN